MIRKFECKECGSKFSSEDNGQVICPHCSSDNVDYATLHIPYKYISIVICAIFAVILLLNIDYSSLFSQKDGEDEADTIRIVSEDGPTQEQLDNELIEKIGSIPPTIAGVSNMEVDKDGNYNFVVNVSHAPKKGYSVVISDLKTGEIIAKSSNGVFNGISFSKNEGRYYAQIVKASTDEALSEKTEITGFVEVKNISQKLSVNELQDLINKKDPSLLGYDNEYLSPVYKIKYASLPNGSDYAPDNLADVFEMLDFGTWNSVEVTSLDYDETKHISSITLKVKAPSRPDFVE